jgi:hypothetical protein
MSTVYRNGLKGIISKTCICEKHPRRKWFLQSWQVPNLSAVNAGQKTRLPTQCPSSVMITLFGMAATHFGTSSKRQITVSSTNVGDCTRNDARGKEFTVKDALFSSPSHHQCFLHTAAGSEELATSSLRLWGHQVLFQLQTKITTLSPILTGFKMDEKPQPRDRSPIQPTFVIKIVCCMTDEIQRVVDVRSQNGGVAVCNDVAEPIPMLPIIHHLLLLLLGRQICQLLHGVLNLKLCACIKIWGKRRAPHLGENRGQSLGECSLGVNPPIPPDPSKPNMNRDGTLRSQRKAQSTKNHRRTPSRCASRLRRSRAQLRRPRDKSWVNGPRLKDCKNRHPVDIS